MSGRHADAIKLGWRARRAAARTQAAAEARAASTLVQPAVAAEAPAEGSTPAPWAALPDPWTAEDAKADQDAHRAALIRENRGYLGDGFTADLAKPVRPAILSRLYRIGRPAVPAPALAAPFYDALGGDERTARVCMHGCGRTDHRDQPGWQQDALLYWSCPPCQALPGWRAPNLAVLAGEAAEWRLACAASVVAGDRTPGRRLYLGAPWRNPLGRTS